MGKLDALFVLKNGYIEICPGIVLFNNNGVFSLNICNLDGLLKGGNFKIKATTPEDARQEIKKILSELYGVSLSELLQEIDNI